MKILGLDVETTGLDTKHDVITEIGAALIDENFEVKDTYEKLVYEKDYPELSSEIQILTGINPNDLKNHGVSYETALAGLVQFAGPDIDIIVAHNASFDKQMLKGQSMRQNLTQFKWLFQLPWICSYRDVQHPDRFKCRKLAHLALDYGVAIDPNKMHRAAADVEVMFKMLARANVNWEKTIARSKSPDIIVKAIVPKPFGPSGDGGKGKDHVRGLQFRWQKIDDKEYPKLWVKKVKQCDLEDLREQCKPYSFEVIQ